MNQTSDLVLSANISNFQVHYTYMYCHLNKFPKFPILIIALLYGVTLLSRVSTAYGNMFHIMLIAIHLYMYICPIHIVFAHSFNPHPVHKELESSISAACINSMFLQFIMHSIPNPKINNFKSGSTEFKLVFNVVRVCIPFEFIPNKAHIVRPCLSNIFLAIRVPMYKMVKTTENRSRWCGSNSHSNNHHRQ